VNLKNGDQVTAHGGWVESAIGLDPVPLGDKGVFTKLTPTKTMRMIEINLKVGLLGERRGISAGLR